MPGSCCREFPGGLLAVFCVLFSSVYIFDCVSFRVSFRILVRAWFVSFLCVVAGENPDFNSQDLICDFLSSLCAGK